MGQLRGRDRSLQSFIDELDRTHPDLADAAREAAEWVQSYDAADPATISVRSLVREHHIEATLRAERAFRLPLGYVAILDVLRAALGTDAVALSTTVDRVDWQPGEVVAHTTGGERFRARKLIVTLPLPVLQQGRVTFEPALPDKARAVRALRMGPVIKLGLRFDDTFWWTREHEDLTFLLGLGQPFPTLWTTYPVLAPLLIVWSAGPRAMKLAELADEEILERALRALQLVFKQRVASRLRAWYLHNWQRDPLAGGAYSYVAVGGLGSQRALARPVADTLFFAGEATEWNGQHGTVHGALASGERAARQVLDSEK
jgi:monoamine oxidase